MLANARDLNRLGWPENAVYIGRKDRWGNYAQSMWANPFKIGKGCTRAEAVEKYMAYLSRRPDLLAHLEGLRGKVLVCWCAPEECHGDVLLFYLTTPEGRASVEGVLDRYGRSQLPPADALPGKTRAFGFLDDTGAPRTIVFDSIEVSPGAWEWRPRAIPIS